VSSRITILTATAALLLTAAAPEEPAMTAGDLGQLCSGTDHVSRNACRIYILGVTQGIAVGIRMADGKCADKRACVPAGIPAEELETTLKKQLAALDSAAQQRAAAGFIGEALLTAFPCAGRRR
jgi:hypothetical protein